nr:hypothetical protein CFP56_79169 [Quercus suber]
MTVPSEQCINYFVVKKRTQQSARRVGSKKPATNGKGVTKKRLREGSMDDVHTQLDVDAGCTSPVNSMGDDSVIVPSE